MLGWCRRFVGGDFKDGGRRSNGAYTPGLIFVTLATHSGHFFKVWWSFRTPWSAEVLECWCAGVLVCCCIKLETVGFADQESSDLLIKLREGDWGSPSFDSISSLILLGIIIITIFGLKQNPANNALLVRFTIDCLSAECLLLPTSPGQECSN